MHNKAYDMGKWAIDKAKAQGFENLSCEDWEELKNCMEVVKSAICAEKDYKIVEAMNESEEADKYERMGYNNRRYDNGRYASAGRGHMGYEPYMAEDYGRMGYMGYNGNNGNNMGYNDNRQGGRYGYAYNRYQNARRHYTETGNEGDKMQMNGARSEVFDDVESMINETMRDATPEEKQRYKMKLQQLTQRF